MFNPSDKRTKFGPSPPRYRGVRRDAADSGPHAGARRCLCRPVRRTRPRCGDRGRAGSGWGRVLRSRSVETMIPDQRSRPRFSLTAAALVMINVEVQREVGGMTQRKASTWIAVQRLRLPQLEKLLRVAALQPLAGHDDMVRNTGGCRGKQPSRRWMSQTSPIPAGANRTLGARDDRPRPAATFPAKNVRCQPSPRR